MIYDQPDLTMREEHFAMNDNMSYSTVARDRRHREDETEIESREIPLETAGVISDRPEQATGGELAMNENMSHSTVARDRRCRAKGVTERESEDIPEKREQEAAGVIYDRPEQVVGGEQFAMNDNLSYPRDRRCRDGEDIPEDGEQETTVEISDQPQQATRVEEVLMNEKLAYSTVATCRGRRHREYSREREKVEI